MKLIRRDSYMEQLWQVVGTPDIKVITGVRRCGKSKLMEAFIEEIKEKLPDANVIHANLSMLENRGLLEYHSLNSFVEYSWAQGRQNFVFIDEVQLCKGFEWTINSLHASGKYDIYITGSNAFLLNNDLATLFTGRTFEIEVYPFSFAEYVKYYGSDIPDKTLDRYIAEGGMAGAYEYPSEAGKIKYISGVYDTLIVRDVQQKYKIRNVPLLEKLSDYLMDNVSNLTSARNIAEYMNGSKEKVNHKTIGTYMSYLCNAFAFYKIRRYDIRGKRWLVTSDKYYLCDHAFRNARLGTKNTDRGRILENIVAIELLRRGYTLYAGMLYKKEIDFVAMKRDETIYIQVADNLNSEDTLKRELTPLLQIRDGYPKMIIARTWQPEYMLDGIRIVDAADWLLNAAGSKFQQ